MFSDVERDLTAEETSQLAEKAAEAAERRRRAFARSAAASGGICAILAVLTLLASDAPRVVILGFWTALAVMFTIWIGAEERKSLRGVDQSAAAAAAATRARERRVQSDRMVAIEEIEDEGACYAFAIDDTRLLFIVGQEYYESDEFPNSDFSIVEALDSRGAPLDEWLVCRGRKLSAERTIPADVKKVLSIPENLDVVEGTITAVEQTLRGKAS